MGHGLPQIPEHLLDAQLWAQFTLRSVYLPQERKGPCLPSGTLASIVGTQDRVVNG